jgi:hypothetical protein
MIRERALKIVLVILGILFVAGIYPLLRLTQDETVQMMLSLYVTLGIFLLIASRDPAAHRSLIAYAAWANIAHAGVMTVQSFYAVSERAHLLGGSLAFGVIGIVLIALMPGAALRHQEIPATTQQVS